MFSILTKVLGSSVFHPSCCSSGVYKIQLIKLRFVRALGQTRHSGDSQVAVLDWGWFPTSVQEVEFSGDSQEVVPETCGHPESLGLSSRSERRAGGLCSKAEMQMRVESRLRNWGDENQGGF